MLLRVLTIVVGGLGAWGWSGHWGAGLLAAAVLADRAFPAAVPVVAHHAGGVGMLVKQVEDGLDV